MAQGTTLPGDTLLITAFISYTGCFTKQFRLDLMNKLWLTNLRSLEPPIPITEGLDALTLLTDDTTIAMWQNEGLPSDRMSIENATILSNSDRWPLMIDPQLQGSLIDYNHLTNIVQYMRVVLDSDRREMDKAKVRRRIADYSDRPKRIFGDH